MPEKTTPADNIAPVEDSAAPPHTLPAEGYVRLYTIIGNRRADPPIVGVLPMSKSKWYAGVASGRYPKPDHDGGAAIWAVLKIRELIKKLSCPQDTAGDQRVDRGLARNRVALPVNDEGSDASAAATRRKRRFPPGPDASGVTS